MGAEAVECHEWQYFVPGLEAGLIEISLSLGLRADKKHVRQLLGIKLNRKRLPPGVVIFPYHSFGGASLRDRARTERVRVDDRIQDQFGQMEDELLGEMEEGE